MNYEISGGVTKDIQINDLIKVQEGILPGGTPEYLRVILAAAGGPIVQVKVDGITALQNITIDPKIVLAVFGPK